MPTISIAVLHAGLDHNKLCAALEHCKDANDVWIVYDGKTVPDALAVLSKKMGWNALARELRNDFSAQRDAALKQASGEWVLFLDDDERVSAELWTEIRIATASHTDIVGFYLFRNDLWQGTILKHGEQGNVLLLRLAKRNAGEWDRPVHEVWKIQGAVQALNNPLFHTPHPTISAHLQSINRYTQIEANYRYARGKKSKIQLFGELCLFPPVKFFVNYVFKRGFLDGFPGLSAAYLMAIHSLCVRVKQLEHLYNESNE